MEAFDGIISDRGSRYAVSGGPCRTQEEARAFLQDSVTTKNDDGEAGAGMTIARIPEQEGVHNHIVVVTRGYGGKHLGGDRFRHVQAAVRYCLDHRST